MCIDRYWLQCIIRCSYRLINNRAFSATRNWGCDSKTASQWLLRIGKPGGKVLQLYRTPEAQTMLRLSIGCWSILSIRASNLTEFHHGFLYFILIIILFFITLQYLIGCSEIALFLECVWAQILKLFFISINTMFQTDLLDLDNNENLDSPGGRLTLFFCLFPLCFANSNESTQSILYSFQRF